jgi:ribosomal protein S18 acetylase RimI-like enzyme
VATIRRFEPTDLAAVLRLCVAEAWPSFPSDPERALRVLTAPGVMTVVAVDDGELIGFAELFSDGELQAYLANLAVDARRRGEGVGRALVTTALKLAGGERIDLLSEPASMEFYRTFSHAERPGLRLYPFYEADSTRPA